MSAHFHILLSLFHSSLRKLPQLSDSDSEIAENFSKNQLACHEPASQLASEP